MEWLGNEWCITMEELTRDDRTEANNAPQLAPILSIAYYKQLCYRNRLKVVRRGGGANCPALISYGSLPKEIKDKVDAKYPNIAELQGCRASSLVKIYEEAFRWDFKAQAYYLTELNERNLSLGNERIAELAKEYATNASVIQAVKSLKEQTSLYRKVRQGKRLSWASMGDAIRYYKEAYGHSLGLSPTRFATWVRKYESEGYEALISKKFGNMNTLKVSVQVEQLLLEMASDKHRPYGKTVWEWYCAFLRGDEQIINQKTGEIYDPEEYPDLSEKTVGDILGKELNVAYLSKKHDARHDYSTTIRPYHKRQKPKYSLSMVSMDDKDFGIKVRCRIVKEKLVRGKLKTVAQWVDTALKAYICYDVASEAIIGYAFSGTKDRDIFERCVRNMYQRLLSLGLGQPHEAQVENHIVSLYKEGMMKSGVLFPEVTFAGAENSQEKYAEHYNRQLKYQFEKFFIDDPIGRPHARLSANRTKNRKANDAENNNYKQQVYGYEEACQKYEEIFEAYNNAPHPNQKLYKGMSRMDVLRQCVHPEIQEINLLQLVRWVGYATKTSVVRGKVQVAGEDYSLSPEMLDRLSGRHGEVEAYRWEAEDAPEVLLFQNDVYLGACPMIQPYQVSKLERGDEERTLIAEQARRIARWDRAVSERTEGDGIMRISSDKLKDIELQPIKLVAMPLEGDKLVEDLEEEEERQEDYASRAWADL